MKSKILKPVKHLWLFLLGKSSIRFIFMDPPASAQAPLLAPAPSSGGGGFIDSCLWFLCCCGLFTRCCPPLFEPGPPPP
ncbi:hypothetical protein Nepgr_013819 [Nepenthes gracilis]|uniref:Uncharacterized protein n=1 Tax=Nepenthes gracilis TaxID=150966 RepID=A0AAD3SIU5_NEPGR|nr:hypothetical protein Nepgr_013819 [Nepenthes gracilis]